MADNTPNAEEEVKTEPREAKPWLDMITNTETVFEAWNKTCDNIGKDYANLKRLAASRGDRELQMLYANLEVLKPSIYARAPQPVVVQRFKDPNKPVPRKAGEMLERALVTSFDTEKVHDTLKRLRDDLALTGRGQMWVRYETYQKPGSDELKQCVRYEWVHRRDFLHEPARFWREVGWVARGVWMTREKGEKRFGEAWKEITYQDAADTSDDYKIERKARVWELWHKEKNLVVWLHPNASEVLDIAPPHLDLEGFFPCPSPAYGTTEPDSLVPVPDPCFYKDQLEEINELTARISALSESLKMVGFYPSGVEDVSTAIETAIAQVNAGENRRMMIGIPNTMGMGASLKEAIVWWPVIEVANTVKELVALRKQLMDDVREISGISDIMRGVTAASETLGAQQLKSQYGSIRIKDRQGEMVRIADNALNLAGEIAAENFDPETLMAMSQVDDLPKQADVIAQHQQAAQQQIAQLAAQAQQQGQPFDPAQAQPIILKAQQEAEKVVTIEKVFDLLRSQKIRPFVLMIATDSTIQPDENAEKKARNEFGQAFAALCAVLGPMIQQNPELAEFAGEMMKFQLAPYRAGRQMEQSIDDFVQKMIAKSKQPPPPNPELAKHEAEEKRAQQEHEFNMQGKQAEATEKQADRAAKTQDSARDAAIKDREAQARLMEIDRKAADSDNQRRHDEIMQRGQERLLMLQIELAELKLKQPKPAAPNGSNGDGAEHGHS